jgi:SAM-dependent methyltransferase
MTDLLLIGRWHAVTRDQEAALRREIDALDPDRLVFVITAADQKGTKRHPLPAERRREIVEETARALGRPFEVHAVTDLKHSGPWVEHVRDEVLTRSDGATRLDPKQTLLLTANPNVRDDFAAAGYRTRLHEFHGALPADVLGAIAAGKDWQALANDATRGVYLAHGVDRQVRDVFADVLLTDDGELSTGRDFKVYAAGMDASMGVKIADICPHVVPGLIVDKGCGTGKLLVHLSELFPESQIVGMDLSRELLRTAESQHYPNQNVSIVRGNIVHRHFPPGAVSTVIFSSVIHEIYSYNRYDRGMVRRALASTREELRQGGRVIIRDGVRPLPGRVWMRCDAETEARFRRFAADFKGKSATPGVRFEERQAEGQTWFVLGLHEANEFLSKKDYLANWAIEVNEEFGVFTLDEWRQELTDLGSEVVGARSYVNEWIRENRYLGRAWLHADAGDRPGAEVPYPDTTAVLVGAAE